MSRARTAPLLALGLLAAATSACHGFQPTVRRTMSADARCPEEKIEVKTLPEGGYQAAGCGKTAVYDCSWPEGKARSCARRGAPPSPALPGTGW